LTFFLTKIDLQDAYLFIPTHPEHTKFLKFWWERSIFQFSSLSFGLASVPWTFTKILKPSVAFLRKIFSFWTSPKKGQSVILGLRWICWSTRVFNQLRRVVMRSRSREKVLGLYCKFDSLIALPFAPEDPTDYWNLS
jgi:hypothetical protein